MAVDVKQVEEEVKEETIFVKDVPIDKMIVHLVTEPGGYARKPRPHRIAKLVAGFEPLAVGVLLLSLREDGTYAIIDGQHRMLAALQFGLTTLDAYVYLDLTLQEEARLYRRFGDYLKQTALDRYVAAQTEEQPETIVLDKLLDEVGLHVVRTGGPEPGGIQAVAAIQRTAEEYGPQHLRDTLALLHDGFGINTKAFTSAAIWGTSQFMIRFNKHPKFQRKRLVTKLRESGVAEVMQRANGVKASEKSNSGNAWGKALMLMHDSGLREDNKLAVWVAVVRTEEGKAVARKTMAEKTLPAMLNKRRLDAAERAKANARCPNCRAEPGADCKNVKGTSLNAEIHNQRYIEYRKVQQRKRYLNGKQP